MRSSQDPLRFYLERRKSRSLLAFARLLAGFVSGFSAGRLAVAYGQEAGCITAFSLAAVGYAATVLAARRTRFLRGGEHVYTGVVQLLAGLFIGLVLGSS